MLSRLQEPQLQSDALLSECFCSRFTADTAWKFRVAARKNALALAAEDNPVSARFVGPGEARTT